MPAAELVPTVFRRILHPLGSVSPPLPLSFSPPPGAALQLRPVAGPHRIFVNAGIFFLLESRSTAEDNDFAAFRRMPIRHHRAPPPPAPGEAGAKPGGSRDDLAAAGGEEKHYGWDAAEEEEEEEVRVAEAFNARKALAHSLYLSAMAITTIEDHRPTTFPARFFTVCKTFSLWVIMAGAHKGARTGSFLEAHALALRARCSDWALVVPGPLLRSLAVLCSLFPALCPQPTLPTSLLGSPRAPSPCKRRVHFCRRLR